MPPTHTDEGLRAAVALRRAHPGMAVVALSQYVEHSHAADMLDSGDGRGVGYLLKDRAVDVEEFAAALHQVVHGGIVVDPEVVRRLLRRHRDPLSRLTAREREVLALIAEGHSNAAMARRLVISEPAVGKHVWQHPREARPPRGQRHQPQGPGGARLPRERGRLGAVATLRPEPLRGYGAGGDRCRSGGFGRDDRPAARCAHGTVRRRRRADGLR